MYNRTNLPLSPRKVIKKSLGGVIAALFVAGIFSVTLFVFTLGPEIDQSGLIGWFSGIIIAICILGAAAIITYQYFYYKLYHYEFTDERGTVRKGVIARATGIVRYERIQNIYVDQDFLDRIFGLYDVHYETAGETSSFYSHVDGLVKEHADLLLAFLDGRTGRGNAPEAIKPAETSIAQPSVTAPAPSATSASDITSLTHAPSPKLVTLLSLIWSGSSALAVLWITAGIYDGQVMFGVIVVLILLACVLAASRVLAGIWFKNYRYTLTQTRGEMFTKVISSSMKYLYYDRIQDVSIDQGILERIFGLYSVAVMTAGDSKQNKISFMGQTHENAEAIKNFLLERAKTYRPGL